MRRKIILILGVLFGFVIELIYRAIVALLFSIKLIILNAVMSNLSKGWLAVRMDILGSRIGRLLRSSFSSTNDH